MFDPINRPGSDPRKSALGSLSSGAEAVPDTPAERRARLHSRLEALLRGSDIAAEVCRAIHPAWHSANLNRRRDDLH